MRPHQGAREMGDQKWQWAPESWDAPTDAVPRSSEALAKPQEGPKGQKGPAQESRLSTSALTSCTPLGFCCRSTQPLIEYMPWAEEDDDDPHEAGNKDAYLPRSDVWRNLENDINNGYFDPLANMQIYAAHRNEARWFEFAFHAMWPFVTKAVEKFLMNDLTQTIRESCADIPMMDKFKFSHCNLGQKKPIIASIKSMAGGSRGDYTGFLFNLVWEADDADIEVEVGGRFKAGLKDLRLDGALLLGLSPLLDCFPITGGLSISFSDPPDLTWKWTGIGKVFNFRAVKKAIVQALFQAIVIPNRVFSDIAESSGLVPEGEKPRMVDYMSPRPVGVLRLEVLKARDLRAADMLGTSDPYVVLRVGAGEYQTKTIHKTLNPDWGEFQGQDFIVYDLEQQVFIEVWDEDKFSQDEALGVVLVENDNGSQAGKMKRPIVAQMAETPRAWWLLDLTGSDAKGKHKSEILIRACFTTPSQIAPAIRPNEVDCPGKCGLQVVKEGPKGLGGMACALCDKALAQSWKSWLSSKEAPKAKVCHTCNFGICLDCSLYRRPACGLLRIILKSARVPVDDASKGATVSFFFEGVTLRSHVSRLPLADHILENVQKAQVANNLRWHAGLDDETIGRCLDMSLDEVQLSLQDQKLKTHSTTKLKLKASDRDESKNTQTVVWDQAFHFVLKDPYPDETDEQCAVAVTYSVSQGMFPHGTDPHLSGKHPLWSKTAAHHGTGVHQVHDQLHHSHSRGSASPMGHADRIRAMSARFGSLGSNHSDIHMPKLQESVIWPVTDAETGSTIELALDVTLEPLEMQESRH